MTTPAKAASAGRPDGPELQLKKWMGALLLLVIAGVATVIGTLVPVLGSAMPAVAMGLLISGMNWLPRESGAVVKAMSKQGLQVAIVLMGMNISLTKVIQVGRDSLGVMLGTLAIALGAAWLLGKVMKTPGKMTGLIGVGTAICGGSAIAAAAPVLEADENDTAYALSTIFFFNVLAIAIFPPLGHLLGMDQHSFGLWAGTAINDTSSVVAAAYGYGREAGDFATVVKLARATTIVPVTVGLALLRSLSGGKGSVLQAAKKGFPWFIVAFLIASLINSVGLIPAPMAAGLGSLGRFLIIAAMAAVGMGANLAQLRKTGAKPLLLGAMVWVIVAVSSLAIQAMTA